MRPSLRGKSVWDATLAAYAPHVKTDSRASVFGSFGRLVLPLELVASDATKTDCSNLRRARVHTFEGCARMCRGLSGPYRILASCANRPLDSRQCPTSGAFDDSLVHRVNRNGFTICSASIGRCSAPRNEIFGVHEARGCVLRAGRACQASADLAPIQFFMFLAFTW